MSGAPMQGVKRLVGHVSCRASSSTMTPVVSQRAFSARPASSASMRPFAPRASPGAGFACSRRGFSTTRARSDLSSAAVPPIPSPRPSQSELEKARRSVELSRAKMYAERSKRSRSILLYSAGTIVLALGVTYAAVPLYRAFCSATGFSGVPVTDPARFSPERLYATPETSARKPITVHFEATSADTLPWEFTPAQRSVKVVPGQTALAFYTAKNTGTKDLIGIATYNMTPEKIAPYFAKVECFCFEEQRIRAGEEVDLPVFFFIDRDIIDEPSLDAIDDVVLSYTFFKARRNDKGHMVPDASEEDIQKSQGFENYELAKQSHKLVPPPPSATAAA